MQRIAYISAVGGAQPTAKRVGWELQADAIGPPANSVVAASGEKCLAVLKGCVIAACLCSGTYPWAQLGRSIWPGGCHLRPADPATPAQGCSDPSTTHSRTAGNQGLVVMEVGTGG